MRHFTPAAIELIESTFTQFKQGQTSKTPKQAIEIIDDVIAKLDTGIIRAIHSDSSGNYQPNTFVKQCIILRLAQTKQPIPTGFNIAHDSLPQKYTDQTQSTPSTDGITRVVPPTSIRYGAYIGAQCIIMPSFINIGAYVGDQTMIDTWATVGSCAQIGKNCHISGGAGIGGVLEPMQASPVIIEDEVFIGARSEIMEGCIVEKGAVIAPGVFISGSTKIYNRMTDSISYGKIPSNSVVVPGTLPSECGRYALAAAIIVKQTDDQTRRKTSVNELLRTTQLG